MAALITVSPPVSLSTYSFGPSQLRKETRDGHIKFELQEPGSRYEGGEAAGASKQTQVPMNVVLVLKCLPSGRTMKPTNS